MSDETEWLSQAVAEIEALEQARRTGARVFRGERIRGQPPNRGARNIRAAELASRLSDLARRADVLVVR